MFWTLAGAYLTYCDVDAYYMPFDQQNCSLVVSNGRTSAEYIKFSALITSIATDATISSNEWTLIDNSVTDSAVYIQGFSVSSVYVHLVLQRESSYYVVTMILPMILLSVVGLMVFPLPPESGEKMSLSVATLMSFFITQVAISQHLPTSWKYTPILSKLYQVCVILSDKTINRNKPQPHSKRVYKSVAKNDKPNSNPDNECHNNEIMYNSIHTYYHCQQCEHNFYFSTHLFISSF